MAFTYLIVNVIFIACIIFLFAKSFQKPTRAWWITLVALLILTLIFDNLAIWAGMFHYAPDKILGIQLGLAPVEDFFYALLAVLLIPTLWKHFGSLDKDKKDTHA